MPHAIAELRVRLAELQNLNGAAAVLGWDQQTNMPPGGVKARARQLATLSRIAHETLTAQDLADLIARAEDASGSLDYDGDDAALVRVARHDHDLAAKLPADFVAESARVRSEAHEAWTRARADGDFATFAPWLRKIIEMARQTADYLEYDECRYDALLDQFEPGTRAADVVAVFDTLRQDLVPLAHKVLARADDVDDSVLHQRYDIETQRGFCEGVVRDFGYDFDRGRVDEAVHPFCTSFSVDDVRITTRYQEEWLSPALFGTMHESGHAMYEQGVHADLDGSILASGASLGVHESQSRLWENIVGRSRGFWTCYYPRLQEAFPRQLGTTSLEDFYRAINKVSASCIRVEADELTYNMHVMLRFDTENALLDGDLDVSDAPAAWDAKMEELLGIRPPNASLGILQDVHWSMGMIGYFPTYTLGNLLSAQIYDKAVSDDPTIPRRIAEGDFGPLRGWLRGHVHRHGRKYVPPELIRKATGEPLRARSYIDYLGRKYGEIYGL